MNSFQLRAQKQILRAPHQHYTFTVYRSVFTPDDNRNVTCALNLLNSLKFTQIHCAQSLKLDDAHEIEKDHRREKSMIQRFTRPVSEEIVRLIQEATRFRRKYHLTTVVVVVQHVVVTTGGEIKEVCCCTCHHLLLLLLVDKAMSMF